MKKTVVTSALLGVFFLGCGQPSCIIEQKNAPSWMCDKEVHKSYTYSSSSQTINGKTTSTYKISYMNAKTKERFSVEVDTLPQEIVEAKKRKKKIFDDLDKEFD